MEEQFGANKTAEKNSLLLTNQSRSEASTASGLQYEVIKKMVLFQQTQTV